MVKKRWRRNGGDDNNDSNDESRHNFDDSSHDSGNDESHSLPNGSGLNPDHEEPQNMVMEYIRLDDHVEGQQTLL